MASFRNYFTDKSALETIISFSHCLQTIAKLSDLIEEPILKWYHLRSILPVASNIFLESSAHELHLKT